VSIETIRPNGEVIYPFYGKHPEGLIMYDNSGWMSVQVVSDPPAKAPSRSSREEVMAAPSAEKSSAFDSYYTYCGTWSLDTAQQVVRHHIRQSLMPGEVGEDVVRRYVLDGNRLTLRAKTHEMGEDHERKLVWQRLPKAVGYEIDVPF
jgi:Lipocalin-like domain